MAVTETTTPQGTSGSRTADANNPSGFERLLGSGDHTLIGRIFIGFSLVFLLAGLLARILVGIDTGTTNGVLGAYAGMVDLSSIVAIAFLGVVPFLLGLAMVVVPLQVGSPAVAFPRAAALSLWGWLISSVIFLTSMALDGGFGGADTDAARLGNIAFGGVLVMLALASTCVATTVLAHRPAGMSLARVPLFAWSMLVAAAVWITSIGAAFAFVLVGHVINGGALDYLDNFTTHLGWLTRGPAVFMLAIPVLGIAGDVVITATRRKLIDYQAAQGLIGFYGALSFGAWAVNQTALETIVFLFWTLGTGLAVLGFLGLLAEVLRQGKPRITAGLVGSLLALVNILGAVVVGLLMALNSAGSGTLFDFASPALGRAQMVFVVAAAVTGGLAGLAHWSVKVWGTEADDRKATAAVALSDIGGGLLATVLAVSVFVQGSGDTGEAFFGWLAAVAALLFLAGVGGGLIFSLGSSMDAEDEEAEAPQDPFDGATLEWQTPSPASGGVRTAELPEIESPYPLLDLEEDN